MQNPQTVHDDPVIADLIRNPEVRGRADNKTTSTDRIPLFLDGRGIKGEGETKQSLQRVIPSKARNLKSPTHIYLGPSYWL